MASLAPRRYRSRPRKLTTEQEAQIRTLAGRRSLRALAGRFGVSHETIRAILATPTPAHGGVRPSRAAA